MTDQPASQSVTRSREGQNWILLLLVIIVGALLRFHMLGVRSLWPPECFSVIVARQPFPLFLRTMWWGEANMAFYYFLLRGWVLLGDSEAWLQALSALFGVLTIPAIYVLGKRFLSPKVGLVAAALIAVNSSHIGHSQQLRCYSLWVLLAVLLTYCFLALLESPHRKVLWLLYIFLAVLLIYTQVFGIFLLAAQWLPVLPRMKSLGIWKILSTFAAIGILSVPMAIVILTQNKGQLNWVPPVSLASFWEVFRNIVGTDVMGSNDLLFMAVLSALYVVAWIVAIWGTFRSANPRTSEPAFRTTMTVLTWSLFFPIIIMTVISFKSSVMYPRYLLMSLPAAILLAAQGLATIEQLVPRGRLVFSAALLVMLASALVGTHRYDSALSTSGNDWRSVSGYILQHQAPGDAIIFYTFGGNWSWDYYLTRAREAGLSGPTPTPLFPLTFERTALAKRIAPYPRVWVVLQQDIPNPQADVNNAILVRTMAEHFREIEQREFTGKSMFPGLDASIHLALYAAPPSGNSP